MIYSNDVQYNNYLDFDMGAIIKFDHLLYWFYFKK